MRRAIGRIFAFLIIAALALIAYMYHVARADPVVREDQLDWASWPEGQQPVRVLIASDLHVAGPDMPPERVERLVEQMNGLKPDLILFAGDFVSDKRLSTKRYTEEQALAPLARLSAPLGKIAVMGNHDHHRDVSKIENMLRVSGFTILDNQATKAGPFIIGGLDDEFTGHDDIGKMVAAMQDADGAMPIVLSHSPDVVPDLPANIAMVAAGHTHCGQIVLPGIGMVASMSRYDQRFACGKIKEDNKTIYVSAGLGTSIAPLRLGAVPDVWLVTVSR